MMCRASLLKVTCTTTTCVPEMALLPEMVLLPETSLLPEMALLHENHLSVQSQRADPSKTSFSG